MNRSICSLPFVSQPMLIPKVPPGLSQDPSFDTTRKDAHDEIQIYTCDVLFKGEHIPAQARLATALHKEVTVELKNFRTENCCAHEEYMIAQVESLVMVMVRKELSTMVKQSIEEIPRTVFLIPKSGI